MDTLTAFAMGKLNRGNKMKVFDWNAAATYIKLHNVEEAKAGLEEDWFFTGGTIFENGEPNLDCYTYLASTWATPILTVGEDDIECWCYEDQCEWDAKTKWPQSALDILERKE